MQEPVTQGWVGGKQRKCERGGRLKPDEKRIVDDSLRLLPLLVKLLFATLSWRRVSCHSYTYALILYIADVSFLGSPQK